MSQSKELAAAGGRDLAPQASGVPVAQRMEMLREALLNPQVDPAKAAAMADLIFRMDDRDREAEFNRDKVAAIAMMPAIFQAGTNTNTKAKYAKFEDMHRKVRPVLDAHNLQISFDIGAAANGAVSVTPILSHRNGITERGSAMVFPPDTGPGRSAVQAVGSSASYGKRHTMKAMLNIVEGGEADDDDGEGGGTPEDRLSDDQRALVNAGRSAALDGSAKYQEWFAALPAAQKGWLAYEPYHNQNKQAAEAADQPL